MFNLFTGLPGSGKSLIQTLAVYPFLIKGYQVYSDYWINFKGDNLHFFSEIEEVVDKRNCVIVFDEISALLEPRNWEQESDEVRKFFSQHRKRHVTLFATTQHASLVAKSARIIVDYWAQMTNYTPTEGIKGKKGIGSKLPFLIFREQPIPRNQINSEEPETKSGFMDFFTELRIVLKKDILRKDLDKFKAELRHWYCPVCCQSQNEREVRIAKYKCPKCSSALKMRQSGIYDTDREVAGAKKDYVLKKFKLCKECGKSHFIR
jgi:predicted SnoaL-like aldol condensation-catalyzing enzyme